MECLLEVDPIKRSRWDNIDVITLCKRQAVLREMDRRNPQDRMGLRRMWCKKGRRRELRTDQALMVVPLKGQGVL